MHMQGTPQNMQKEPSYTNVLQEITTFFKDKTKILQNLGVNDIILDVGFGFGKNLEHNYTLLNNLEKLNSLGYPILAGISNKSMLSKVLHAKTAKMKNATSIANTIALLHGAKILRVHNVKNAMECVKIVSMLK